MKIKAGKRELESTDFRDLEQIEAVEIVPEYEVDEQSDDEFLNDKIYSNEKNQWMQLGTKEFNQKRNTQMMEIISRKYVIIEKVNLTKNMKRRRVRNE